MTVEQLYEEAVSQLPKDEQMRLATYIAWKCARSGPIEYSGEWSDEDLADFSKASQVWMEAQIGAEDDDGLTG